MGLNKAQTIEKQQMEENRQGIINKWIEAVIRRRHYAKAEKERLQMIERLGHDCQHRIFVPKDIDKERLKDHPKKIAKNMSLEEIRKEQELCTYKIEKIEEEARFIGAELPEMEEEVA